MARTVQKLTAPERRVDDFFEWPMVVVTLLLLATLLIPLFFTLSPPWIAVFAVANLVIWFAYYVELFVKLYVAKNFFVGLKRNWFLVVIALSPLFLTFRLIRTARLLSVIRLLGFQQFTNKLRRDVRKLIYNIEYILITLLIFIVIAAVSMWQVETRFEGTITSLADALWWAVVTITTIGYGDIIPTTPQGKVLGALVGLLGTVLFMVFVARITILFVHDEDVEQLKRLVRDSK